jgi:hypothetical protein
LWWEPGDELDDKEKCRVSSKNRRRRGAEGRLNI